MLNNLLFSDVIIDLLQFESLLFIFFLELILFGSLISFLFPLLLYLSEQLLLFIIDFFFLQFQFRQLMHLDLFHVCQVLHQLIIVLFVSAQLDLLCLSQSFLQFQFDRILMHGLYTHIEKNDYGVRLCRETSCCK